MTRARIGRRVAVYGGGNTAMDAARTARRLGAEPLIIYRRTRNRCRRTPSRPMKRSRKASRFTGCARSRELTVPRGGRGHAARRDRFPYRPANSRRSKPTRSSSLSARTQTRRFWDVPGVSFGKDGTVVVGPDMQTGCPGVFAGGDVVPSARTITTAVGHGKTAARHIDACLRGDTCSTGGHTRPTRLRLWYQAEARRVARPDRARPAAADVRRGRRGLDPHKLRGTGATVPVLRQLFRMRRVLFGVSGTGGHKTGSGTTIPIRPEQVHGMWDLLRPMSVWRDRDGRGTNPANPDVGGPRRSVHE